MNNSGLEALQQPPVPSCHTSVAEVDFFYYCPLKLGTVKRAMPLAVHLKVCHWSTSGGCVVAATGLSHGVMCPWQQDSRRDDWGSFLEIDGSLVDVKVQYPSTFFHSSFKTARKQQTHNLLHRRKATFLHSICFMVRLRVTSRCREWSLMECAGYQHYPFC